MRQFTAMLSLGVVLALTALIWSGGPRTHPSTGTNLASLSISDIMLRVDTQSLPRQQVVDRSTVF